MSPLEVMRAIRDLPRSAVAAPARALLWAVATRADSETWIARAGIECLAEDAGLGVTAAKAAMGHLAELGLVERPDNAGGLRKVSPTRLLVGRLAELASSGRAERVARRPVSETYRSRGDLETGREATSKPVARRPGTARSFCPGELIDPPLAPPDGGERAPASGVEPSPDHSGHPSRALRLPASVADDCIGAARLDVDGAVDHAGDTRHGPAGRDGGKARSPGNSARGPADCARRAPDGGRTPGPVALDLGLERARRLLDVAEAEHDRALGRRVDVDGELVTLDEVLAVVGDALGPLDAVHVRAWLDDGRAVVVVPSADGWLDDVAEALGDARVAARVVAADRPDLVGRSPRERVRSGDLALVEALCQRAGLGRRARDVQRVAAALGAG